MFLCGETLFLCFVDVPDLDLDRSIDSEGLIGEGPGGGSSDGGLVFPSVSFESAINGQDLDLVTCEGKLVTEVTTEVALDDVAQAELAVESNVKSIRDNSVVLGYKEKLDTNGLVSIDKTHSISPPPPVGESEVHNWKSLSLNEHHETHKLNYFAPICKDGKVVVQLPISAVKDGISKWVPSLVGQFLGKPLPFHLVKNAVEKLWGKYGSVQVYSVENGMFLFCLESEEVGDAVLGEKLWYIGSKPLFLRKWTPGLQILKLSLTKIPIWLKILHLPLEYWNPDRLSYIASRVGKPLYADEVPEEHKRLGFARVFVEIDINEGLHSEIVVDVGDGSYFDVLLEYPWLPVKCAQCNTFGHSSRLCNSQMVAWKPKDGSYFDVLFEYPWLPVKYAQCNTFGHPSRLCNSQKVMWKPKERGLPKADVRYNKQQAPQAQQVPPPESQKDGATSKQVPSQGVQKVNSDVIHARDKGKAKAGSASPVSSQDGPSRPSKDYSSKSGTSFSPVTFQDFLEASLARQGESSKGDGPNFGGLDPPTLDPSKH